MDDSTTQNLKTSAYQKKMRVKRQPLAWEKIVANQVSDKVLTR